MASIHQACGRMVAPGRTTSGAPVSARMLAASAALLRVRANNYSPLPPLRPTAAPRRAGHTPVHGLGSGRASLRAASARARMRLLQAADQMHTPSKELLPFRRALPAACAPRRLPTAPGAHATADWQGEALDNEPVARGDAPPTFAGIQTIQSASGWRRRWKRETLIRPDR